MSYILFCTHIRFHFKIIKHLVNKIFLEPLLCSGYFECFLFYSCPHRANILLFDSQGWREDIRSRMNECVSSTNTYTLFFLNCKNTELSGVGINGSMKYSLDFTWDFKKKKKKNNPASSFLCREKSSSSLLFLSYESPLLFTQKLHFWSPTVWKFAPHHQAMPCHLQEFHSILTLPTWSEHQTAEVKGSIPREGISPSPSFWPTSYRLGVPMTTSLSFIYLLRVAHRTQRNILLTGSSFL